MLDQLAPSYHLPLSAGWTWCVNMHTMYTCRYPSKSLRKSQSKDSSVLNSIFVSFSDSQNKSNLVRLSNITFPLCKWEVTSCWKCNLYGVPSLHWLPYTLQVCAHVDTHSLIRLQLPLPCLRVFTFFYDSFIWNLYYLIKLSKLKRKGVSVHFIARSTC